MFKKCSPQEMASLVGGKTLEQIRQEGIVNVGPDNSIASEKPGQDVEKWQTPYDRGMMCGTCRHWSEATADYGACERVKVGNIDDFEMAYLRSRGDTSALITERKFSCSYWGLKPPASNS
jgi:hypothetical protein